VDCSPIVGSLKYLVIKASGRLEFLSHSTSGVDAMTLLWKLDLEMRGRFLGYLPRLLKLWFYYRSARELSAWVVTVKSGRPYRAHRSVVRLSFFGNARNLIEGPIISVAECLLQTEIRQSSVSTTA
jgi:hypothetical protein